MASTIERLNRVREVRESRGLTQGELATRLGCSVSNVHGFEMAARSLRIPTLRRIAKALGCSVTDLMASGSEQQQ